MGIAAKQTANSIRSTPMTYAKEKLKALFRRTKYTLGADVIHFVLRHTRWLDGSDDCPPDLINFAGGGDFKGIGDSIVQRLTELAHLQNGHALMEIGCGIGRNATALERSFTSITYDGFDIVTHWSEALPQ